MSRVMAEQQLIQPSYLGDAVYASFDGYHIWLKTEDGNHQRIALEPSVYFALREYAKRIWGEKA